MADQDKYAELGIVSDKRGVHTTFSGIVSSDVPHAFCNIIKDPWNPGWYITKHPDGSGSKSVQRCLHYMVTGDVGIFAPDIDDALSMNTGDIAASGFTEGPYLLTDVLGINALNGPKGLIMEQLVAGFRRLMQLYEQQGIQLVLISGETADLPDQINSYVLDIDVFAKVREEGVIRGNVLSGDSIFGFSSGGQAVWEDAVNSGHMSNGLTLTRISLMHSDYAKKYPHLCRADKPYTGRFRVDDHMDELGMTVSEAILSPTRQWAFVARMLVETLKTRGELHLLHAMVMNTGGGLSKCLNVGNKIRYVMEAPEPLPIFQLVQGETGESWRNMATTYNCGIGFVVIGDNSTNRLADAVSDVEMATGIDSQFMGECEQASGDNNQASITIMGNTYDY